MHWLSILIIFTLFFTGYQLKNPKKRTSYNNWGLKYVPKLVNINTCPFVVGFVVYNKKMVTWKCGGAIIHSKWAVTTASCLSDIPRKVLSSGLFRIRSNTSFLEEDFEPFIDHTIVAYYMHRDYNTHSNAYDSNIAVAMIADQFTGLNEKVIKIPRKALPYDDKSNTMVYTWHKLLLHGTNVSLVNLDECRTMYQWAGGFISNRSVCGIVHGLEDFCNEMEGSALVWEGEIFGIASSAYECSSDHFPAVFTRVDMFRDWIFTYTHDKTK